MNWKRTSEVDTNARDRSDLLRCMDQFGPNTTLCRGGRIVCVGFICPHCGSSNPDEDCRQYRIDNEATGGEA